MNSLVIAAGAAIVLAEAGMTGWLAHRWLARQAPGIAAWIPRDGGAVVGFLAGAGILARWAVG